MNWHIVSDSSCDLYTLPLQEEGIDFATVPFSIRVGDTEYMDTEGIDIDRMLSDNEAAAEPGQTACPSPQSWYELFVQPGPVVAFTISKELSGSYNSACTARQMVLEEQPDKQIAIIDTRSTGPELVLLIRRACALIREGIAPQDMEDALNRAAESFHVAFALASYRNLIKAGRVNRLVGILAGHLGIWGLGVGDEHGRIAMHGKARGEKGMIRHLVSLIREFGVSEGRVVISHCMNESAATAFAEKLKEELQDIIVEIIPTRGLDSFYAERRGLIVGF